MTKRMWMATISLLGLFVAIYLALYKLGYIGTITCSVGSCETVQTSKWATFLGMPVAVWGVGYYAMTLAVSLAGMQERFLDSRGLAMAMLVLTGWGAVFSAWLTYLELWVIHAICQWCVVSAVLATILFVFAWMDWRETGREEEEADEQGLGVRG